MSSPTTGTGATVPRSTFVTVLAWLGIVVCGFASLIGLLQNIMVRTMFRDPTIGPVMADSVANAPFPPQAKFMFGHIQVLVLAVLLCSLIGLAASIGLLQRRNWARLTVIAILALGIVWNLLALTLQQGMFTAMSQAPLPASDAVPTMAHMFRIMRIAMTGITVAFCVLFGWLIARLVSAPVRAEFDTLSSQGHR